MNSIPIMDYAPRVKICGITRAQDIQVASQYGVNALGFMLYEKSKRNVTLEDLGKLTRLTPPFITKVAVMVDPDIDFVKKVIRHSSIDCIQLHGQESPEFINEIPIPVIKAFRVKNGGSLEKIRNYNNSVAWLLDSFVEGELGGTGHSFNWDLAKSVCSEGRAVILAGGLNPDNIMEAVRQVRPFAVDVSSGVETSPGIKCPVKMKAFLNKIRTID